MADKRQVFIACHLAVASALASDEAASFDDLAGLALVFGRNFDVSAQEIHDMLRQPLADIPQCH